MGNGQQDLSRNTKAYLQRFQCILDKMIRGMTGALLTDSISHNFIAQMIPHHMAAIEMSENILRYTTDIPVQNIALQIVAEQTKSIENMRQIETNCGCVKNSPEAVRCYQNRVSVILKEMFAGMQKACTDNRINADFMREMIPHHEGAVRLCENALQQEICPQLCPILENIIVSQKRGIVQMKTLLTLAQNCRC